jgi:predicted NUDIX family NTP pyrophosphohydrolase
MMAAQRSAGLLMYRLTSPTPEFLLVHPGGPFWMKRDAGAWSIPKGLCEDHEDPLGAAKREFEEETGCRPEGNFVALGRFKQPSGKTISAWGLLGDFDLQKFRSNLFTMEWPPKSKRFAEFPEADRAGWFGPAEAFQKISSGQAPIIDALLARLGLAAT